MNEFYTKETKRQVNTLQYREKREDNILRIFDVFAEKENIPQPYNFNGLCCGDVIKARTQDRAIESYTIEYINPKYILLLSKNKIKVTISISDLIEKKACIIKLRHS